MIQDGKQTCCMVRWRIMPLTVMPSLHKAGSAIAKCVQDAQGLLHWGAVAA